MYYSNRPPIETIAVFCYTHSGEKGNYFRRYFVAIKIMLDAGHSGKANRSPVVREYWESERMWLLCEMLAEELLKYGFEVLKTRKNINESLGVFNRGAKAKGCDLFISLHSNAVGGSGNEKVDRVEVYGAYDNLNNSRELASRLATAIVDLMQASEGRVKTRKSQNGEREYYGVLRGARSVGCPLYYIVEHSFHTNERAARWLMEDANLRRLAVLESAVIAGYYGLAKPEIVGDVNQNGELDARDVALIKRALLGSYQLNDEQERLADVNGDGDLTALDYMLAKRKLLKTLD